MLGGAGVRGRIPGTGVPLALHIYLSEATWRSGYAADCKSVYAGSIPAVASKDFSESLVDWAPSGDSITRPMEATRLRAKLEQ